ncbi:conserved hypothetical protein [Vibrio chagasii]|nr:conserved hypothetical protein [Vibrio chagasii]
MNIYIQSGLDMPFGKTIAQSAHAYGKAWLDRMSVVSEDEDSVILKLTDTAFHQLNQWIDGIPTAVSYCELSSFELDGFTSEIVDSGRTHFECPTLTCRVASNELGEVVGVNDRLSYSDKTIECKQGFFVNRVAFESINREVMLSEMAKGSFSMILDNVCSERGELELKKAGSEYVWLTSSFGKTVVGTKKVGKFEQLRELLVSDGVAVRDVYIDGILIGYISQVLPSDSLQKYTRYKTFRLLE